MALLKSFIDVGSDSHFPIQNLPYGVFKPESNSTPRPAVAIGDLVLDLSAISQAGLFDGPILKDADCFLQVRFLHSFNVAKDDFKHCLLNVIFSRVCSMVKLVSSSGLRHRPNNQPN